jgi:hypothetical protein
MSYPGSLFISNVIKLKICRTVASLLFFVLKTVLTEVRVFNREKSYFFFFFCIPVLLGQVLPSHQKFAWQPCWNQWMSGHGKPVLFPFGNQPKNREWKCFNKQNEAVAFISTNVRQRPAEQSRKRPVAWQSMYLLTQLSNSTYGWREE